MLLLEILMTILFSLFLPFYYIERVVHKKSHGWREKFGGVGVNEKGKKIISPDDKVIHIHCCSVGEALAIENLLKSMRVKFPEHKIVVTTFTYAGQQIAQKKFKDTADYITYFPFDNPIPVKRFLDKIHPDISIIAETEIWPYFAYSCKMRGIPLIMINARISDLSYASYRRMKFFFKKVFKNYAAVYAQSLEDKEKFISVGLDSQKAEVMGNLKFDIEPSEEQVDIGQDGYRIFLAGSTHKPENEIVISTYKKLKEKHRDLKLLIAPRHLERVEEIKSLLEKYELSYGLRSDNSKFSDSTDVIILNTLGELKKMYSICNIAFIGGSFNNTGGHNPLEAAIFEKPVVSGPAIFNFKDIYEVLTKSGAGKVVKTPDEFYEYLNTLLEDSKIYDETKNACKKVFTSNRGAIEFVIGKVTDILNF